ncbi:WD repeat-containing protein 91 [Phytophthora boehmeriae]|uniref:WD repeat-containing protein 91 n=1 Tax=Phytophthora boehmeriae TaxID=109152 RepID=A0A8T1X542_9STRA|nr:WD repeat-containing protein 91 [Phytophthora boehmeriae]
MNRGDACKKPSLVNRAVQKRRENAITEENRRLKERLTHLKPYYDTKKWDDEWHQHAHKFSHMHQDGTVGYLLPHTKMSAKGMAPSSRGMCRTSRVTPANASGLPSLGKTSKHNSIRADRPKEQSAKVCGPRGSGSRSDDSEASDEDAILQVRELEPCLLLEATTRSGVEVSVDELQIELTRSGIAELGDRGLMIRAAWKDGIRGELLVNIELLIQVAQVVDDLEIMIKLETVSHIPNAGNIPSLSTLLTDDELKKLLVGTVQQLRFQVSTTPPSAVSQSRLLISWGLRGSKIGVPDADNDKCNNSNSPRERLRPRTCPSTIASNHEQQQQHEDEMQDDYYEEDYNEYTGRSDIKTDMETRKLDWAAQLKAATILNMEGTRRRTVLRKGSVMYLVSSWFEEETSVQTIKAMGVGSTVADAGPLIVEISYNPREIEELLHQLDEGSLTVLAMIKKTVGPFLP